MKRIISLILVICLVITLAGCRPKGKNPAEQNNTDNNVTQSTLTETQWPENKNMVAVSVPAVTEDTVGDDGTLLFQYTYQHMSLVLNKPEVADKVILDFLNRVDSTRTTAETIANTAKTVYNGNKSWTPYLYHITYSPTRIDHNVLSLFGNNVAFSGTPHPERTCVSASYDLQTGDVLTLASIMDKDASLDAFCKLVLGGLTELAEGDYLYEDYKQTVTKRFQTDASQDEAWYFTQTGMCFYFAPYEIAPYTSGVITVEIPYEKLKGLIHEDYQPEKRNKPNGIIRFSPFDMVNQEQFSHVAEIVTSNEGKMYMAQTDGYVQDIRILSNDNTSNYTIFAAYALLPGDGIMIQADDSVREKMKMTYKNATETVTTTIG